MIPRLLLALCLGVPALAQIPTDNAKPASPPAADAKTSVADPLAAAQALLKKGEYATAAAAFKSLVEKNPASAGAQAGLVRSLLRALDFDEAEVAGKKAVAAVPSSALVHAAFGDVNFRMGKFAEAEAEYRSALKLDPNSARGWFGLARMLDMVSMHKKAKLSFAKAHELDPEDKQIYGYWMDTLSYAEQLEVAKKESGGPAGGQQEEWVKYLSAVTQKKPWVLASEVKATEIKMVPYGREVTGVYDINRSGPATISKGYGLQVKFNDRAGAVLLLDTGAGGITIGNKLAEKAGAVRIAETKIGGIGDKGPVTSYEAWIDKITIGGVEFHNCIVEVSSRNNIADEAGLIGPDIFAKFLITLDFHEQKLLLAPLPKDPSATGDDDSAQDRYIAPEMQSFTKFYRFGHDIVVPAQVNDKAMGNFILDTGSDFNSLSTQFAARVTKASADDDYRVSGVSGKVDKVLTGKKAILQFAGMRIESHDLPVFSTDNLSANEGTEIAGLVGIKTLVQMKMTIDYRDGLVNLQVYNFKKAQE